MVMLTLNLCVENGLLNGSLGTVTDIVWRLETRHETCKVVDHIATRKIATVWPMLSFCSYSKATSLSPSSRTRRKTDEADNNDGAEESEGAEERREKTLRYLNRLRLVLTRC